MSVENKVDGLLGELVEEEKRLRSELAGVETRAKDLKVEIKRVQSAIKALEGKGGGGKKRGRRASQKKEHEKNPGASEPSPEPEFAILQNQF